MVTRRSREAGFTLMEIIVVLAVIGALTAVLVPVVFRYIDDARKGQAQSDVSTIAAAIQQMYKDTGRWPFYVSGTSAALKKSSGNDFEFLTSNTTVPTTLNDDTNKPALAASWTSTAKTDTLENQLIKNTPGYVTTTGRVWKGPYLDKIPLTDPWGRSYLVNIGNADPNDESTTRPWTIVISGGPNGLIDTASNLAANTSPSVAGDDIIARVK